MTQNIPILGIFLKKSKTLIQKDVCIPVFIAALFIVAKIGKRPKCPTIDDQIKMWCMYTMECYSIKKN